MKKFIKNNLLGFILGVLVSGGVVYAATLIDSKDVTYTPSDSSFDVSNVESALDDLYDKVGNKFDMSNAELIYFGGVGATGNNIVFSKDYSYVIVTGSYAGGGWPNYRDGYITSATMSTSEYTSEYTLREQNPPVKIFTNVKKDAKLNVGAKIVNDTSNVILITSFGVAVIGIP